MPRNFSRITSVKLKDKKRTFANQKLLNKRIIVKLHERY